MNLHWLPVQQRVLFKVLILTYKAYYKTASANYLCDLIIPYSNSCNLRYNNQLLLSSCQPRTKLKTYGEGSFQYAAPNECNKLPLIIREIPYLVIFKNKLKTFYFNQHIVLKYIFFLFNEHLNLFITTVICFIIPLLH